MEILAPERRINVYNLLPLKHLLRQTRSFSDPVERCNFSYNTGWRGKTYVDDDGHDIPEYKPVGFRGIEVLDIYYLKPTDYVVLTEEQYRDFRMFSGH